MPRFFEYIQNDNLINGQCPICNTPNFRQVQTNFAQESFDYFCQVCDKIICVSGTVLQERLLDELPQNNQAQIDLKAEIKEYPEKVYSLLSDTLVFFLYRDYKNTPHYLYQDWYDGKVPGLVSKYQNIVQEDKNKIREEQIRILDQLINVRYEELVLRFTNSESKSSDPETFLQSELSTLNQLFTDSSVRTTGDIQFGNWTMSANNYFKIQKYYKLCLRGEIDYDQILSPNQKTKIGIQKNEMQCLVDAMAYTKYNKWLKQKANSKTSDNGAEFFTRSERIELNERLDNVLKELEKLGLGQQIIFDEIDESFRKTSERLPKKDFKTFVYGKLGELVLKKVLNTELASTIFQAIFGEDLNLLNN